MAFKKGQSGNPAGRKPGTTPGAKIRHAIEKESDAILTAVIKAAKSGDMAACKMLLDRITPTLKPAVLPIKLPAGDSLSETGESIIKATLTGKIAPDIGSQLITALANQSRLVELDEILKRIEALEHAKH